MDLDRVISVGEVGFGGGVLAMMRLDLCRLDLKFRDLAISGLKATQQQYRQSDKTLQKLNKKANPN